MAPSVSVVVCTLDRIGYLRTAIDSLLAQEVEPGDLEVLVVDNGSTDGTVAALQALAHDEPALRVVTEPTPGLSHARNTGVEAARGEFVLFVDDDAVAHAGLVAAHLRRFRSDDPPVATGGRIHLRWPDSRPAWLPAGAEPMYSWFDRGDTSRPLTFPEYPYGANMAVRRDVLLAVGGFATALGRTGANLISCEEKELFLRVADTGQRVDYVADAVVDHQVLPDRAERRWFLRRSFAQGRSDLVMEEVIRGRRSPAWRRWWRAAQDLVHGLDQSARAAAKLLLRKGDRSVLQSVALALEHFGAAAEGVRPTGVPPAR